MLLKSVEELQGFMRKSFTSLGVSEADADICSQILITSDLRGIESHGIGRLRMYVDRIRTYYKMLQPNLDAMLPDSATDDEIELFPGL